MPGVQALEPTPTEDRGLAWSGMSWGSWAAPTTGEAGRARDEPQLRSAAQQDERGTVPRRQADGHGCVWSVLGPPRSISNRVVQRHSAEGTGEMTPWESRSMHHYH